MIGPTATSPEATLPTCRSPMLSGISATTLPGPFSPRLLPGLLSPSPWATCPADEKVAEHDARASELNEDMRRWVRDRDRQLDRELRTLVNQAGSGIVSRFPVPPAELPPSGTGSQLHSGALTNEAVAAMRQALHEYRDEATAKVREFSALARGERRWHGWYRRRRGFHPPTLGLGGQERIALGRWRQRPVLVNPGSEEPDLVVGDDPTAGETTIQPLEADDGLTWAAAAARKSI
jgi:hypothetical protein